MTGCARLLCWFAVIGLALPVAAARAADPDRAVGVRQIEYVTPKDHRPMWMAVFYPAVTPSPGTWPLRIPFVVGVTVYPDAAIVPDGARHPLIMLSHGRGSDAWQYAWLAQALAARGYIVAALNHYRANTYHREIGWLANRIWQRPIDVSLAITHLMHDPFWSTHIDAARIGVAGHSQGGFTALWIGGARVNRDRFLAFQRLFINNPLIPQHIRRDLPLDAAPALDVQDRRVKAVFAMAPGVIQAFGMDPDGLRQLDVPAFLVVGAGDTQTPPKENAEYAARYIPGAQLWVIPGEVDHEIFTNECDEEGRSEFPEGCIDKPGVDRHALHGEITEAALACFGDKLSRR
jgi:predicted dienelactone hydrolase